MRKYHKKMSENANEINKQIQGMHDEISAAHMMFLDDQLCVVNNKATNHE